MSYESGKGLVTIQELERDVPSEDMQSVWAEGINPESGYNYDYVFVFEHPKGQYIRIDTEKRASFLEKGDEQSAQNGLVEVTQATRKLSGGAFDIHPFYGAVFGTRLTPVSPGFLTSLERLDESLSTIVNLTDAGDKFDEDLTSEALAIGTTVAIPGPQAERLLAYMQAKKTNPNQANRDQAIANGLGRRWEEEFRKFNHRPRFGRNRIPKAMEMTPQNIGNLLQGLGQQAILEEIAITRVNYID